MVVRRRRSGCNADPLARAGGSSVVFAPRAVYALGAAPAEQQGITELAVPVASPAGLTPGIATEPYDGNEQSQENRADSELLWKRHEDGLSVGDSVMRGGGVLSVMEEWQSPEPERNDRVSTAIQPGSHGGGYGASPAGSERKRGMIDLHNHLIPGVDDGASTLEESRAALQAMTEQGVDTIVTTSHLDGSVTTDPLRLAKTLERIDSGWSLLEALAASEFPQLRLERGLEVMLDTPEPDLSDPRVRLAGTRYVLVEFPHMTLPPRSVDSVFGLKMRGWTPVIAHPERYAGIEEQLDVVAEWRRVGGLLQVNAGSLVGRYGADAKRVAWRLLGRGWVDLMASDYHARGAYRVGEARQKLINLNGGEAAELLLQVNPRRLLDGEDPLPVPQVRRRRISPWKRIFKRRG